MKITSILSSDAHWNVNKKLARDIGLLPSILLMELIFCREKYDQEEFYESVEKLDKILGVGSDARRSAMKVLVEKKYIQVIKKGIPARYFYRINDKEILDFLIEKETTSDTETPPSSGAVPPITGDAESPTTYNKNILKKENKNISNIEVGNSEHLKRGNDPFAVSFDSQNASIVFDEIKKYTIEKFKTKPSPDPLSCSEIASRCIAENETDLREEIRYKLEIYEYCQFFSEKFAPAPKRILQAWDQLIDTALPEHKRRIKTPTRSEPNQDDDAPIMEFLEEEPISEEQKKRNLEEIDKVIKKSKL